MKNWFRGNYFYIDKTLFIKELIEKKKARVNLFTRPRRFGKTLNMSMLRHFFGLEEQNGAELFRGLKIMEAGDEYLSHMGKYPVISLSLKSMKQPSYELAFEMLKKAMREEYLRHWPGIEAGGKLDTADRERYLRLRDMEGTDGDYADALKFLSECLYRTWGRKAVILIDEYDVPLESAYFGGFYDRMIPAIRSLFESALKTNGNLEVCRSYRMPADQPGIHIHRAEQSEDHLRYRRELRGILRVYPAGGGGKMLDFYGLRGK